MKLLKKGEISSLADRHILKYCSTDELRNFLQCKVIECQGHLFTLKKNKVQFFFLFGSEKSVKSFCRSTAERY